MANVQVLTAQTPMRLVPVGFDSKGDVVVRWDADPGYINRWTAAVVPITGGDPVVLPGGSLPGGTATHPVQVSATGSFEDMVSVSVGGGGQVPYGGILKDGRILRLSPQCGQAVRIDEDGVYGSGPVGRYGFDGKKIDDAIGVVSSVGPIPLGFKPPVLAAVRPDLLGAAAAYVAGEFVVGRAYVGSISNVTARAWVWDSRIDEVYVPEVPGFEAIHGAFLSPDGRYLSAYGLKRKPSGTLFDQFTLVLDLLTDAVIDVAALIPRPAVAPPNSVSVPRFAPDGALVCMGHLDAATYLQPLVRVTGWES